MLKRRIRARNPAPENLQDLESAAREEWANIPHDNVKKNHKKYEKRMRAIIKARGGHTRY